MDITRLTRLKEGQWIIVKYWDHWGSIEEDDKEIGILQEVRGFFVTVVPHKYPLLKLAMHADLSWPFMFILTNCIETIEVFKRDGKQYS